MNSTTEQNIATGYISEIQAVSHLSAFLRLLVRACREREAQVYGCGGSIRNIALQQAFGLNLGKTDFDFVVESVSEPVFSEILETAASRCDAVEQVVHAGRSFPVWKIKLRGLAGSVDVALARTEESFGQRRQDFIIRTKGVNVLEDSLRRDFTVNAMFIRIMVDDEDRIHGLFIDPHKGIDDIGRKLIRTVGKGDDRFEEDPLRMLRAIRFCAALPGFRLEEMTSAAIKRRIPDLLANVSQERIIQEMYIALKADPHGALLLMREHGVLDALIPEIAAFQDDAFLRIAHRIKAMPRDQDGEIPHYLIFAALLIDIAGAALSEKLRDHLSAFREDFRIFCVAEIDFIAKRLRLAGIKQIVRFCNTTLQLVHYSLLENPEAVLESIMAEADDGDELVKFYDAYMLSLRLEPLDVRDLAAGLPPSALDFSSLIRETNIPHGPYLNGIKLSLRQCEINGEITDPRTAREFISLQYGRETRLIEDHIKRLQHHMAKHGPDGPLSTQFQREICKLLFTRPVLLLKAYRRNNLLATVLPELAEAEENVQMTPHHFSGSFFNDTCMALSILSEEETTPSPVQILATLLLDIGMARTLTLKNDGTPVYYRHDVVGAEMVNDICSRLGVEREVGAEVGFIVRNHNALIQSGAETRIRKLMETADMSLILDLLLVHKVDQIAKMKITNGGRADTGQLDTYYRISASLHGWHADIVKKREREKKRKERMPFLSGMDLMADNPSWGLGLREGREVGMVKNHLLGLQVKGIVRTLAQAREEVRKRVVLHHLMTEPLDYLETLKKRDLLEAILPEVAALIGLEQASLYHREDAFTHTCNVVYALPSDVSVECRLAAVFHDIGKPAAGIFDGEKGVWHFYGHEQISRKLFARICRRYNWENVLFDVERVEWLIGNHMKIGQEWSGIRNPHKVIEKLFYRTKDSHEEIPMSYRNDLLELRKADIQGSVPANGEILLEQERNFSRVCLLFKQVEENLAQHRKEEQLKKQVHIIWNGGDVLQHFKVSGHEIGRLVKAGRDYVIGRMEEGRLPEKDEVIAYVRNFQQV